MDKRNKSIFSFLKYFTVVSDGSDLGCGVRSTERGDGLCGPLYLQRGKMYSWRACADALHYVA